MHKSEFVIDFLEGQTFEGYTQGEEWNGFACPYFTFQQAQTLVEAWRAAGHNARYDSEADCFAFEIVSGEGSDYDSFPAIEVDGLKVYPVGASCWIWEEMNRTY